MYSNLRVQDGDILQHKVKKNDWIGKFVDFFSLGGGYVHTSIYVGNGLRVEAQANTGKIAVAKIKPEDEDSIDIFRLVNNLTLEEREKIIECAYSMLGYSYDYLGLLGTLRSTIGSMLNWGWLRKSKPALNEEKKYFCSELASYVYSNAIKIDIVPEAGEYVTTPNDITKSKVLERIS